jgi:hypothetical protein
MEHFFKPGGFLPCSAIFPAPSVSASTKRAFVYAPDPAKSRIQKFNNHGRLVKSWPAPQKPISPDERPVVGRVPNRIILCLWRTFPPGASRNFPPTALRSLPGRRRILHRENPMPLSGLAAAGDFVFTMAASSGEIRVWTADGQHKLDADLGANLGKIAAPQLAVTPHAETARVRSVRAENISVSYAPGHSGK